MWATVGSDNFNRRSWTYDSELTCAVLDETPDGREPLDPGGLGDGARRFPRDLRLHPRAEHLEVTDASDTDLLDPNAFFPPSPTRPPPSNAGTRGPPRPAPAWTATAVRDLAHAPWTVAWATPFYRLVCDPDGRPRAMRRSGQY